MNEWQLVSLADVVTLQRGHDLPSQDRGLGQVPIIGSFGITGTHDVAKYQCPGVAIGRSGASIGIATFCKSDYWPLNTCLFAKDFRGNDPRWVYYLLDSIDFTSYNSGSAQPSLNRNYLANIPISLPPFAEQRAIAEVLGAIDDKIDSNKQIVKTAEALVESLYLHSVRGAGLVPMEPWVQVQMGSAFKGEYFSEAVVGRPLIRIRDLKTFEPQVWTTEIRPDEIIVQPGDVVVGMDAEFRSTLWLGSQAVLNQRMCRFVPADGVSRAFALETIRRDLQFYEGAKSGTTVIHLNKSDIERFRVPELRIEEHQRLGASTDALIDRLIVASQESGALGALRDALLTALLSGRIRVAAAAELVDAS